MLQKTDGSLLELGAQLEQAWSDQRRCDTKKAYEAVARIVRKIEASPAHSLEGLRVKARAIAWCHAGEPISFGSNPTMDVRLALSIVDNLMAVS
jgi:hypothetical protein